MLDGLTPIAFAGDPPAARRLPGRVLFDASPDALVVVDPDWVIREVNDQATELFGYLPDELVGQPLDLLVPDTRRWGHRRRMIEYSEQPAMRPMGRQREVAARRRDGAEVPVAITLSPLHTDDGLFVIAAVREAGEQRIERERLKAAEELLRTTIDHAPIGMGLVGIDGRWLRVNRALCEMTGFAEHDLLARTLAEICHPDDRHLGREDVALVLSGESKSYETEKRFVRADGRLRWVLLSGSLVRDPSGAPKHFVIQIQDITERKDHEAELRHLAAHDVLTGLPNRRTLEQAIDRQLEAQTRYGDELSLLMVDLDHFKYINDTLGHRVGDEVIREAARTMVRRLRTGDLLARLGGDEFAILLPRCDQSAARAVAGKLLESLSAMRVPSPELELTMSASIGVVAVRPQDEYDRDALMAAADLTMYEAKQAGRGRFAIHDAGDDAGVRAGDRPAWSHRIRRALREDRFVVHYQPIVALDGSGGRRYEALIRMVDAPGELIEPDAFLPIAERYGLMGAIDRSVITEVIRALGSGGLPGEAAVAINLSIGALADPELTPAIEALLAAHAVAPAQLIFEITESDAVARLEDAVRCTERLRRLGCQTALDRFGAAGGALVALQRLRCDYLKLDRRFTADLDGDGGDRVLIAALVGIGRGMGMPTIATFVEDETTLESLRALGVEFAQGHQLGRPAPAGRLRPSR